MSEPLASTATASTLDSLFPGCFAPPDGSRVVTGLTMDSRAVRPGMAFVALAGSQQDGARFIGDAVRHGAIAIVGAGPRPADLPTAIAHTTVANPRRALALAAALLHPRQPETIVAVTGTSGKSSVAEFTRQIHARLGRRAASLGTIGVVTSDGADYGTLTTPDPVTLHETLDRLATEDITHLAMEASSHGLEQCRLDGVRLSAGAFLNLGHDHLDYHVTQADYLAAKLRLWDLLPVGSPAIVNLDGAMSDVAARAATDKGLKLMTVGKAGLTLSLAKLAREGFGQRLEIEADGRTFAVTLPLAADYMAGNALVAAALAIAGGEETWAAIQALSGLTGVKGRIERVAEHRGGLVVVDYAHKPDALAAVLDALRPYATGRLICVFGCGGDRDRSKRPLMGAIAVKHADIVIVTDDNPRSENPASIRAQIMAAAAGAREIGDRAEGIRAATAMLQPGDVLVVAGKGHETGQIIGDRTLPFSDHDAIHSAIAELAA